MITACFKDMVNKARYIAGMHKVRYDDSLYHKHAEKTFVLYTVDINSHKGVCMVYIKDRPLFGDLIKQGLQKYCETAYFRSGITQMWILKNSKELLEHLKSPTFNRVTSIKSFDFSTLYTTIPHQKLKDRLTSIIRNAFIFKNGNRRYKYLVLGHEETYFVKEHSDSKSKYSEDDIIKMLEFLVDNIFVVFAGKVFQ